MRVSVIVPAYNAAATLDACLAACLTQSHSPHEVIVVDDGSTDETAPIARAQGVRVVQQRNAGPAAARNAGAWVAVGDVLAFTDSDCCPRRDWVERLLEAFTPEVAAVGGTYAIANPASRLARLIQAEIAARHAAMPHRVDFLGSFNVAYRRATFERVGGFDERFRHASGEDNDLAYRIDGREQGERLMVFTPHAVVAHHHPERLGAYLRTQARHGYWRVQLYRKHAGRLRRGDRYASPQEMLGAPLSCVTLAALVLTPLVPPAVLGAIAALACWRAGKQALLRQTVPLAGPGSWALLPLWFVRDVARGLGLVRGLFTSEVG